jgi:hypothetical protein
MGMMKVEMQIHGFNSFAACFWQTSDLQWEGVVTQDINDMEVKIIKSEHAILLLRKSDFLQHAEVSNESSR